LSSDRSIQRLQSLNKAFQSNDLGRICRAVDKNVHRSVNILQFARTVGVDRSTLYRAFRSDLGPKLDLLVKIIQTFGFHLAVNRVGSAEFGEGEYSQPMSSSAAPSDTDFVVDLTRAFSSNDIPSIVAALEQTLRAQASVAALADKMRISRQGLYRAFYPQATPYFSTVLGFLIALGLQLEVRSGQPLCSEREKFDAASFGCKVMKEAAN
jgi:DNA-binding phage protein